MNIMEDMRPIKSVTLESGCYPVGPIAGITKIIPYEECGEMTKVVWFEILRDEIVITRINGKYVMEITY